jgi:hypothetical protein
MHRRDLEIRDEAKVDEAKQVEPSFHFSDGNYGDYGYFYLFKNGNPHNRHVTATCDWQDARGAHC